eukprot:TRINITY_DN5164_c0_g2_i1.p1 TRINITY_DN5164_c0_g2~~TRINITY_DN5164_c0_g2_i1.p1  ORF type:complete len:250 (-),score=43.16 TRINITY_DN5164_c0_g2_i1:162-854(-)
MELHVVETEGIPEGCVLSVRAGATRRQAPVSGDRPFRFASSVADAVPFKVDVLEPVATARLILRPGDERKTDCQYTIPLEPSNSFEGSGPSPAAASAKGEKEMSVTVAVQPVEEPPASKVDQPQRPDTSGSQRKTSGGSNASSRIGQASAAREYLDKHNLVEFTQLLVQSVIKEQPERPYDFMARQFYFPEPEPRRPTASAGGVAAFGATMATIGAHGGRDGASAPTDQR